MGYLLSIDAGTQSLRAIIFDKNGNIIDKEQIYYEPYIMPQKGWAEQNAELYWQSLCNATQALKDRNTKIFEEIQGVSVTTQRATVVCVDKNGTPLRPAIIWLDQRKAPEVYKPDLLWEVIFRVIGMRQTIKEVQTKGKSNWIKAYEPKIWESTHKYLLLSGYLNYKLTGEFVDSVASQIGYIPFDYQKRRWANPRDFSGISARVFPVEKDKLVDLVEPTTVIGTITAQAAKQTGIKIGTKVIASGSDKGCETLAMGVISEKYACLSFGTTATVQTLTKKYLEPIPFMPAYPAVAPKSWNPEIEIFRGYWMINWFRNEFGHKEEQIAKENGLKVEQVLDDLLDKTTAGSMGLIVQPYWSPGLGHKHAKGAMLGFGDVHKKEHIYRALVEGLAFALKEATLTLQKRIRNKFQKIFVTGGASQSDKICQITSDVFDMPLYKGKTSEASALGAAIVTAVGCGFYDSLNSAVEAMTAISKVYEPISENAKFYNEIFHEVYLKIYGKLEPVYYKIRKITNYPEL